MGDLHLMTLFDMSSGKVTSRTGTALEAAVASQSDIPGLCLQLLAELSQRHTAMANAFDSNIYLLRYLEAAPEHKVCDAQNMTMGMRTTSDEGESCVQGLASQSSQLELKGKTHDISSAAPAAQNEEN